MESSVSMRFEGLCSRSPKRSNLTRRGQLFRACQVCRKDKKKCSSERPCRRCIQLGCQDRCVDPPRKGRILKPSHSPCHTPSSSRSFLSDQIANVKKESQRTRSASLSAIEVPSLRTKKQPTSPAPSSMDYSPATPQWSTAELALPTEWSCDSCDDQCSRSISNESDILFHAGEGEESPDHAAGEKQCAIIFHAHVAGKMNPASSHWDWLRDGCVAPCRCNPVECKCPLRLSLHEGMSTEEQLVEVRKLMSVLSLSDLCLPAAVFRVVCEMEPTFSSPVDCSEEFRSLLGVSGDEISQKAFWDFIYEDDVSLFARKLRALVFDGMRNSFYVNFRIVRHGAAVPVVMHCRTISGSTCDDAFYLLCLFVDLNNGTDSCMSCETSVQPTSMNVDRHGDEMSVSESKWDHRLVHIASGGPERSPATESPLTEYVDCFCGEYCENYDSLFNDADYSGDSRDCSDYEGFFRS